MAKSTPKSILFDTYTAGIFGRTEGYANRVRQLYAQAVTELLKLAASQGVSEDEMFEFDKLPKKLREEANKILRLLYTSVYNEVQHGIRAEWEYANLSNDIIIKRIFGDDVFKNEGNHFARWFGRNQQAMDAFLKRKTGKDRLGLSERIWNYTGQLKDEMELALSVSMGQGESASAVSRKVRKYLQEPERLFRHVKGKDGKMRWSKAAKAYLKEHDVGRGQYLSSYKNAMRLTRTETNMAYRSSDYERWQQLDFVLGIHIQRAHRDDNDKNEICEILQGDYPKTFKFTGWHPQCRCIATSILATPDEMIAMRKALKEGKDPRSVLAPGRYITEPPAAFTQWIDANRERIENAASVPYFIRDNYKDGDIDKGFAWVRDKNTVLEKAKIRHDARTEEQRKAIVHKWNERKAVLKYGDRILNYMDGIKDVDVQALRDSLKRGNMDRIMTEAQALKAIGKKILSFDKLDNPMAVARATSMAEAKTINDNVTRTLSRMPTDSLSSRKSKLEFEIDWMAKEGSKRYPATWKYSQDAYKKELSNVERLIDVESVSKSVTDALAFAKTPQASAELKTLASDMQTSLTNKNIGLAELKTKAQKLNNKYNDEFAKIKVWLDLRAKASTAIAYAATTKDAEFKRKATYVDKAIISQTLSTSAVAKKVDELNDLYQKLYAQEIAAKYGSTPVRSIDDIMAQLGKKTPKTLRELAQAIKKFKYTDKDLRANEVEINALMKKMFDENDFGMDIKHYLLEKVFDEGFLNTFQTGTSQGYNGSSKTTGDIEETHGRLRISHKMFLPSTHSELKSGIYMGKQLARSDYEKYGHLLDRDKADSYSHNLTHYGDVQVRFKKDRVLCTWTFNDSLHGSGEYFQPSLTSDPRIESFDKMCYHKPNAGSKWNSLYKWQRETGTSYIELQYHGEVTIDMVESMTFSKNPANLISQDLIRKLLGKGIELWYMDGGKAVRYMP